MTAYRGKRALDLAIAVPALVLSLPIQAATAALIRLRLGSPVLFRQTRPGLDGRPFEMRKFRTMVDLDPARNLVTDDDRMTPLGLRLRALSLDELPTLWNVVRGDMSLVGPRPLLMRYLDRYTSEQARRHEVRPGITGLAQVNGRNAISWEEKFAWDVAYVDNMSLGEDLRIVAATVGAVVRRDGISAEGHETMPEFLGAQGDTDR